MKNTKKDTRDLGRGVMAAAARRFRARMLAEPVPKYPSDSLAGELVEKRKRIYKTSFRDRKVLYEFATVTFEDDVPTVRRKPDR